MNNGTIERTALAGGDGDDGPYIRQGIEAIEAVLKMQMQVGPGEFYIEPIAFAPDSLGAIQKQRRNSVGIHTGRMLLHRRNPIAYTPHIARLKDETN